LSSSFPALNYFLLQKITEVTNSKICSAFAASALCAYFSLQILQFMLMLGAQKIFCLGYRGSANGYAADYGTSRRFQKYYVIDAVL